MVVDNLSVNSRIVLVIKFDIKFVNAFCSRHQVGPLLTRVCAIFIIAYPLIVREVVAMADELVFKDFEDVDVYIVILLLKVLDRYKQK